MKIRLFTDRIFENKGIYENVNVLCLVSGELKESHAYPFLGMLLDFLIKEGYNTVIPSILYLFSYFRSILLPLPILFANGISMGRFVILPVGGEEKYIPAEGWINTFGLFGVKKWEGNNIYGQLFPFPLLILRADDFIGINGFTGFRFQYKSYYDNCFYFGYALMVNIDYKKPSFS
jgi:hypothetical protein